MQICDPPDYRWVGIESELDLRTIVSILLY